MDPDRRKTLIAITIIVSFIIFILIVLGAFFSGKRLVSPVPEDDAIKIIFITSTPTPGK